MENKCTSCDGKYPTEEKQVVSHACHTFSPNRSECQTIWCNSMNLYILLYDEKKIVCLNFLFGFDTVLSVLLLNIFKSFLSFLQCRCAQIWNATEIVNWWRSQNSFGRTFKVNCWCHISIDNKQRSKRELEVVTLFACFFISFVSKLCENV